MSDLQPVGGGQPMYGGGGGGSGRNNSNSNNGVPRPQIPQPTGSPGIRGPKQVMIDRAAREEKKKQAEQAERDRIARAEEERLILEHRRISDERKAQGLSGGGAGGDYSRTGDAQRISDQSQRSHNRIPSAGHGVAIPAGGLGHTTSSAAEQKRAQRAAAAAAAGTPRKDKVTSDEVARMKHDSGLPDESPFLRQGGGDHGNKARQNPQFPHAFERWESLSSHWEGLTAYWIRKIEENSRLIENDPINLHLARQVTDLTAAGANLFHAVVELQRLRASSERKFQRWFFDTRQEAENMREQIAQLQKLASEERAARIAEHELRVKQDEENRLLRAEIEKLRLSGGKTESREIKEAAYTKDKQIVELKRELDISKSEARRAWEELGRREQEERDRTGQLRDGQPTIIGGVQVVPMTPGAAPSRNTSTAQRERPATRDGTYPGGPTSGMMGGMEQDAYQGQSSRARAEHDDPFTSAPPPISSATRPTAARPTTAPSSQGTVTASSAAYYQQMPATAGASGAGADNASDLDDEYEIDAQGNYVLDASGHRVPYRSRSPSAVDENDYVAHPGVTYQRGTSSGVTSAAGATQNLAAPDYSGQAYSGWEDLGRHQHPTRLSDVIEEDERSRTSASQVSRGN